MKAAVPLLVTILVVGILNLLQGFGVFGGNSSSGSGSYQYVTYAAEDIPPFVTFLAKEAFKDRADEEGNVTFPQAELFDIRKSLPRMLNYMSDEGWELVTIKEATGVHVFRRPLSGGVVDAPRPWMAALADPAPSAGDDAATGTPADNGAAAPAGGGADDSTAPAGGGADDSTAPAGN